MGSLTRRCGRCGRRFFPGPSNAAGRASAGLLVAEEGPVCNPCLDEDGSDRCAKHGGAGPDCEANALSLCALPFDVPRDETGRPLPTRRDPVTRPAVEGGGSDD